MNHLNEWIYFIESLPSLRLSFSNQTQYKLLMMTESEENATAFLE